MSWYRDFYPRSRPRQAKGGIKAQSQRGQFGASWWAKRWIAVLESFNIGTRLGRGRSYARNGQVLSIDVQKGEVKATVQGSRPQPYGVRIQVQQLSAAEWTKAIKALSGQALYLAKLLAGEMPEDVEKVFTAADVSLFPKNLGDLKTACSCPDYSNPCKHIAAVYYLLGEEFDRDPFLIFQLRGLSRDELLARLPQSAPPAAKQEPPPTDKAARGSRRGKSKTAPETAPPAPADVASSAPEKLPDDAKAFWSAAELPPDLLGDFHTPPLAAALPKRLGNFPFWRGQQRFLEALEPIYRQAGQEGMRLVAGEAARTAQSKGGEEK